MRCAATATDERRERQRHGEPRERRSAVRMRGRFRVGRRPALERSAARRHAPRMQWHAQPYVQDRVDDERLPPSDGVEQVLRQRPEHGAREAAEQRERGDRAPVGRAGHLVQRRERRVVQRGGHRDACERASPPGASTAPARSPACRTRARPAANPRLSTRRPPCASICRPTKGDAMPDRKSPAVKLPKSQRSPTPVSARIAAPSTAIV